MPMDPAPYVNSPTGQGTNVHEQPAPLTDSVRKADAETQDIRFTPMPVTASHE